MSTKRESANQIKILKHFVKGTSATKRQEAQREVINEYEDLRSTVLKACLIFRNLAQKLDPSDSGQSTDRSLLIELAETCGNRLLELIPPRRCERIRSRAESAAEKHIRNLGQLEFLARAELRLRSLAYLCLETSSYRWSKPYRIPEWEILIRATKQEFHEAVEEWERIQRQFAR